MKSGFDISKPMQVGGQAVIEGVMMRAPGMVATAVRRADGSIAVHKQPHVSLTERYRTLKLPVVRGGVALVEMLVLGIRTLNFSAAMALADANANNGDKEGTDGSGSRRSGKDEGLALWLTVSLAFIAAVGLFFVVPLLLTSGMPGMEQKPLVFNLVAGGFRIAFLLAYLGAISFMRDVRRLFQYHGAEHKAVFAFELGLPLNLDSAQLQSRFHPRCGTSFLLIVLVSSIVLFAILDTLLIAAFGPITLMTRLATHLPLVPLVGGISYEFIKLSAKHSASRFGAMLVAPGLWLQRITTKEPDHAQLEVALAALCCALGGDNPQPALPEPFSLVEISTN
jgi:uncharacterized protein YqhQ